jgi:hypothetical protein
MRGSLMDLDNMDEMVIETWDGFWLLWLLFEDDKIDDMISVMDGEWECVNVPYYLEGIN